jgi:hypothetical protein
MCKAPKPPKPKEPDKPEFLRNRYLDGAMGQSNAVNNLRSGRSTFRIPLAGPDAASTAVAPEAAPVPNPVPVAPPVTPIASRTGGGGTNRTRRHLR